MVKVYGCIMRVVQTIKLMLVTLVAATAVLTTPMAAATSTHACCPDPAISLSSSQHGLISHLQHSTSLGQAGDLKPSESNPSGPEHPCDISCCATIANIAIADVSMALSTTWDLSSDVYAPVNEIAFSAAQNLHTPPPRQFIGA